MRDEDARSPSSLEWSALTALSLAVAFVFALTQPSVSRPPPGFPTFIALSLTFLACALEVVAITQRLTAGRAGWLRGIASVISLIAMVAAGGWLISREPGRDVLFVWIVAPPTVGIGAVAAAGRRGSWSAVAFLTVAGILVALLAPRWLRLG
jgi:hypothetical protein